MSWRGLRTGVRLCGYVGSGLPGFRALGVLFGIGRVLGFEGLGFEGFFQV